MRVSRWALVLLALAAPVAAQKQPSRKQAVSDSNDAREYYRVGLFDLSKDPPKAAASLYWATRLQPTWAQALYLRRIAELRADDYVLVRYFQGDKKVRKAMAAADSLLYRARMIEPFLLQEHDKDLLVAYIEAALMREIRVSNPSASVGEVRYAVSSYIQDLTSSSRDPGLAGWLAFSDRRYPEALNHYARAIGKQHKNPDYHDDRATIFFVLKQYDSAAAELRHAVDEMKKEEKKETAVIYRPKALLQYRLAHVFLMTNRIDSAKAALGRALEEDLAFYPAHLTLAAMAVATGDSAAAKGEMDLAVQLEPGDAYPFMRHADLAAALRDYEAAAVSYGKVIALEPYYADPHRLLGEVEEARNRPAEAIEHYRRYLSMAVRGDRDLAAIRERIRALGGQ
ncbi:MAG: tetratricopeptide repeat protein [Gemmatimonadetes bacterium]|nr:tetratricopeptide repeat protein [Gemmatimonadota bacterium]